ncbi:hypothetical protein E8E12_007004 [Didymella heteroderae]|uniref:Uncharacterized protein n=1 Tax=Didymella heteroderae TaxID=1769908 RepID=A0A9P4WLK1_9PLEO|nr:hypothetical protein E8E12_007004 [Didymella heteroderae]
MPYQKMIDALQMVPENRKRQGLLEKGKAKETADVGVGLPRQDGDAEVNVEAPSTSVVGESTGLIDEAPVAVDHRETTPPTMVPAAFQERDKSTASDADIEDPGPRSVAVVYPSSDDDAKYPIDQLTQSDEEEGTTPAETSMS